MKGILLILSSLFFFEAPTEIPKAPAGWRVYQTCDFTSQYTGLRIVIYYQGSPCGAAMKWVGYRQQHDGGWEASFSNDWGKLDMSQFICCTPV